MSETKLAVIVSDLHCGSEVALAPPKITSRAGNVTTHGNNFHQAWLWQCWESMVESVAQITLGQPAAHHMGTTSRAYLEASLMSIQMGNARLNYMRVGHKVPQVYLRSHRHCGGYFSDMAGLFCVTGAWQMLTRHGFKVVTDSIPRPSAIVLDWRGKKYGELPQVNEIKFDPPQNEIHKA